MPIKYRSAVTLAFLVALAAPLSSRSAWAGAWTLKAETGQVVVTGTWSTATDAFDGQRTLQSTPRYTKAELQALIEYGLADWLTLIFAPGLQHIDIDAPVSAQRTGLGYTEFGGRYRVWENPAWVLSLQATLRAPGTYDDSNPAAVGYTGVETDIRALVGHNFKLGVLPAYVDVQLAQRFRDGGPPDEFRADLTLGIEPSARWLLLVQSFSVFSEGDASPLFPSYDYHKLQLSARYSLTPAWAIQAGAFSTYLGRNALQENAGLLALWYKF